SHDSQGLTINISNLDQVETQPDIQYIESHNKQISIEKTMEQKTHLGFLENSNSEQLIINEKKIELDYLTKPEEQLELKSQQLDERNITIDIHNTQEYDMQDINNNEDQEYIEDLIDYEGETFTQELGTEQEEINQKTYDDGLDDNIQLRIDNLNVIGSTSQQDSTLDFTKVLLSHDLTERVKIIEQLADKAVMTFNEGNTELEIQIKPEHLGKLVLKVGLDDGVLTGKIYTVTQEIKEFLQENLDVLRNSLRDQGLVFASLDVDVGSQSSSYNFKYLPSSQSSSRKASKFTNFITIETDEGKSTLLGSLSKIDYLA
ncbi:MAG: flagellar hook-length control protein FliK, partial [Clostridiales bacterium]|nr:flagellar hook-length control protein FliK [Clostridiales bacterium]